MIPSSDSPLERMISANSRWRRLQVGVEQQTAHADHRVHRRADLVAHGREERALRGVRLLGEAGLLLELREQVGVGDRDRGLLGERLHDPSVPRFERSDLAPVDVDLAVMDVVHEQADGDDASNQGRRLGPPAPEVFDEQRLAVVDAGRRGNAEPDVGGQWVARIDEDRARHPRGA